MTPSKQVLDQIRRMSVADLADLVRALEREITGRGGTAAAGVAVPSGAGVSLRGLETDRTTVISAVREITDLGLREARSATGADDGDRDEGLEEAGSPARPIGPPPSGENSERMEIPVRPRRAAWRALRRRRRGSIAG